MLKYVQLIPYILLIGVFVGCMLNNSIWGLTIQGLFFLNKDEIVVSHIKLKD